MKIPEYKQNVGFNIGYGSEPKQAPKPVNPSEYTAKTFDALNNIVSSVTNIAKQIEERQYKLKRLESINNFNAELNYLLYNEKDGIMNRKEVWAIGISDLFNNKYKELSKKYSNNDDLLEQELNGLAIKHLDSIMSHEASQIKKYRDKLFLSTLDSHVQLLTNSVTDLKSFDEIYSKFKGEIEGYVLDNVSDPNTAKDLGIDEETAYNHFNSAKTKILEDYLGKFFDNLSETNPESAKIILEKYKNDFTENFIQDKYEKINKNYKIFMINNELKNTIIKNGITDGVYLNVDDLYQKYINDYDALNILDKLVKEKENALKKVKDIKELGFFDEISKIYNNGESIEKALTFLNSNWGKSYGENDYRIKEDFINKLWESKNEGAKKDNPLIYAALWTDIMEGKRGVSNIVEAFNNKHITSSSFISLYKLYYERSNDITKNEDWDLVKIFAENNIKDNKKRNKFYYVLGEMKKIKPTESLFSLANEIFEKGAYKSIFEEIEKDKIAENNYNKFISGGLKNGFNNK